jgi:hypothetical protein
VCDRFHIAGLLRKIFSKKVFGSPWIHPKMIDIFCYLSIEQLWTFNKSELYLFQKDKSSSLLVQRSIVPVFTIQENWVIICPNTFASYAMYVCSLFLSSRNISIAEDKI